MSTYTTPSRERAEEQIFYCLENRSEPTSFLGIAEYLCDHALQPGTLDEHDFERLALFEEHALPDLLDQLVEQGKLTVSIDAAGVYCYNRTDAPLKVSK